MSEGARYIDLDADRKLVLLTIARAFDIAINHLAASSPHSNRTWGMMLIEQAREQAEELSPVQIDQIMRRLDPAEDEEKAITILIHPPTNPDATQANSQ